MEDKITPHQVQGTITHGKRSTEPSDNVIKKKKNMYNKKKKKTNQDFFGDNDSFAPLDHSGKTFDDSKIDDMDMNAFLESSEELVKQLYHWETGLPLTEDDLSSLVEQETLELTKKGWEKGKRVTQKQPGDPSFYTEDGIPHSLRRLNLKVVNGERLGDTKEMQDLVDKKTCQFQRARKRDSYQKSKKGTKHRQTELLIGSNFTGPNKKWGYAPSTEEMGELKATIMRQRELHQKSTTNIGGHDDSNETIHIMETNAYPKTAFWPGL